MDGGDRVGHETRLRAAVLAGDELAWQAFYDQAASGLRAYVYWRSAGMAELADDIVQETWLTAVRRIGSFRPARGGFDQWLRGVAANVIRNRLRHRRRNRPTSTADEETASPTESDAAEMADAVARALAELPSHYEEVLRAKYLDGLSVRAIGDRSGNSAKAIESLLTRARQAFREAFLAAEPRDG